MLNHHSLDVLQADFDNKMLLCDAYAALGDAFMCERDHPETNIREAVKWYIKCVDMAEGGATEEYKKKLKTAGQQLTGPELDAVLQEIYHKPDAEVQSYLRLTTRVFVKIVFLDAVPEL